MRVSRNSIKQMERETTKQWILEEAYKDEIVDYVNELKDKIEGLEEDIKNYRNQLYDVRQQLNQQAIEEPDDEDDEYDFSDKNYEIAFKLKKILKKNGLTQKELCEATEINQGTMSNIINNPLSASAFNIFKICNFLDLDIRKLYKLKLK